MVLGLLFGMAAAWTLAEGALVLRGGMSSGEENKFDNKNGARGIDPTDVVKIAQRNGVYPNKHGVLPAEPNSRIISYVRRYANSPADVDEFKKQWYLTVRGQLNKKHEKIRTENKDEYNRTRNLYECSVIPYLGNDTIYLEISHWHFMQKEIHEERMQKIINETVFGQFVKSSALRDNHIVNYAHIEYYELRLPKGRNMSKYEFKELYKLCCSYLGFEHQI